MHVVALNWRDLKNPRGGGAEVHMEEILRHLGHRGHRCTLITSRYLGAPAVEEADGYRIVRGGHELDFNLYVPFLYRRVVARAGRTSCSTTSTRSLLPALDAVPGALAVIPHSWARPSSRRYPVVAAVVYAAEQPVRRIYRRCQLRGHLESTRSASSPRSAFRR